MLESLLSELGIYDSSCPPPYFFPSIPLVIVDKRSGGIQVPFIFFFLQSLVLHILYHLALDQLMI